MNFHRFHEAQVAARAMRSAPGCDAVLPCILRRLRKLHFHWIQATPTWRKLPPMGSQVPTMGSQVDFIEFSCIFMNYREAQVAARAMRRMLGCDAVLPCILRRLRKLHFHLIQAIPTWRKLSPMASQVPTMGSQVPPMGSQVPTMGSQVPPMGPQVNFHEFP